MQPVAFYRLITMDTSDLLSQLLSCLKELEIRFCVIGGQAVNAYAEPLVSLDLDLVIAADQLALAESALAGRFSLKHEPHSLNVSLTGSALRVQIQTDPRYFPFVARAEPDRDVLGNRLPVARKEDVLQGKLWAYADASRRPSKRQKDLADILRLVEAHPRLLDHLPAALRQKAAGN
ncbi:MAG: hypothetical protein KGS61_18395 [Verrucomicrobia bacterium]|nr:hypothetical protein [Verrucomicrobiota bacterium]